MQAIVQDRYGSADVLRLEDIEEPAVGDDDVLVRVHAAGVDPGVWHLMTGEPLVMRLMGFGLRAPKDRVRGRDLAGRVERVGKNVAAFRPGDHVFGTCDGSFAELARAREQTLAPMPANLSFEQAAAVPTSGCTALKAVRDAGSLQPGQTVLVVGAAGGVGSFAVQIARSLGGVVTGVCSTSKVELVRSIGAEEVVDYTSDDFTDGRRAYDLIVDTAGNRPLSQLRRALTTKGTLVIVGGEGGGRWFGGIGRGLRAAMLSAFVGQTFRAPVAVARSEGLNFLAQLLEAGDVEPVVDRTYALADAPEALRQLEQGHARGKTVIRVASG
jgi:NADPH:quinone reductase-like Zn-dependent oxidoreductase